MGEAAIGVKRGEFPHPLTPSRKGEFRVLAVFCKKSKESKMIELLNIVGLPEKFDLCLKFWHEDPADFRPQGLAINEKALELAHKNYLLWHEEDKARRLDVTDAEIAGVKRSIDRLNQQRNDMIEKLDEEIILQFQQVTPSCQQINSETPGSIVDRISILSLKVYHMREDTERTDISAEHREKSLYRLEVLTVQRQDLYQSLVQLLSDYR